MEDELDNINIWTPQSSKTSNSKGMFLVKGSDTDIEDLLDELMGPEQTELPLPHSDPAMK